ncbi:MAG: anaerobic ribonucleoside-triphosphate reductase activating protein [Candidatus Zophobacter franzmannii]|nr:anaerobic ribonucleoside-triphosphate reductase activating protein [Candidatus Zophobacter franzmannii]
MKYPHYEKFSMIDYPGKHSAIVFTQGCNLRCPFCHNPSLVLPDKFDELHSDSEFFSFLEKRIGKLDAVTITGGEPLLQDDLIGFCQRIKDLGFLVKIDTNGTLPTKLKTLVESQVVEFVAMDIKASEDKFKLAAGGFDSYDKMLESMDILRHSGLRYEFRTTVVSGIHKVSDLAKCIDLIHPEEKYYLQPFQPGSTLRASYRNAHTLPERDFDELRHIAETKGIQLHIR